MTDTIILGTKFNKHGVSFNGYDYGICVSAIEWDWLGAKVEFEVLGKTVQGEISAVDSIGDLLTAEFYNNGFRIEATASYPKFRKAKHD